MDSSFGPSFGNCGNSNARRSLKPTRKMRSRCCGTTLCASMMAVMNEGRIEQVGSPEDVYLRPRSRFVAGFLGAVNWISGAGIRPEAVRLLPAGPADNVTPGDATPGDATRDRRVPGVVTGTVFLGDCVQVLVRLSSGEDAVAQLPRRPALFQPGDAVQFTWSAADEMTFP